MSELQAGKKYNQLSKIQCISGFTLKMIGLVFMVMDHIHQMFYMFDAPMWLTMAGRIVLPIFLFMVAEGYHYTHDKKKYMLRLLVAFWLMNIGNFALSTLLPLPDVMLINGIFGTMFLSVFYMWAIDYLVAGIKAKKAGKILTAIGLILLPIITAVPLFAQILPLELFRAYMIFIPSVFSVEAGVVAIIMAVGFKYLRNHRLLQVLMLAVFSIPSLLQGDIQWMMVFAAVPILMYNGKPGRKSKYLFYVFYPAHIYVLYIISYLVH